MQISQRLSRSRESGTARIAQLARELKAAGRPVLQLNVGEPDFDTPDFIVAAAREAMSDGKTRYTDVAGTRELRHAVARKFRDENRIDCRLENTIVGTGAKQLIFNALMATLDPGDEVLIPAPYWVSYPDMVLLAEGKPVIVPSGPETGYKLSAEAAERFVTERTRWILLNSPCNPSGAVYSSEELAALAELPRRYPDLSIMCDDIYERIILDDIGFATMAEVAPDLSDRILTVNGVSKSHAMTGWRIGYAAGPSALIQAMTKIQGQSTTNPSSIGQAAAQAALEQGERSDAFIRGCLQAYRLRRDRTFRALRDVRGLVPHYPSGAFYLLVRCDDLFDKVAPGGLRITTDGELCSYLLQAGGVSVVPGSEFGCPGHFRLSFAASDAILERACVQIGQAIAALT